MAIRVRSGPHAGRSSCCRSCRQHRGRNCARRDRGIESSLDAAALPSRALVFEADLAAPTTPAMLVGLGWDLADLARRYRRFVARFERVKTVLHDRPDPMTGFILRTLLIHEYRRLHLRDPLLPQRLLPSRWPGIRAAELSRSIYERVFAASEAHLSAVAARLDGDLPAADRSVLERFGGIAGPAGLPSQRATAPKSRPRD